MKSIVCVMSIFVVCLCAILVYADDPGVMTISTNSVCVSPSRSPYSTVPAAWVASTSYAQGATFTSTNGIVYFVEVAGTSTNTAPSHTSGSAANGTLTCRYIETGSDGRPVPRVQFSAVSTDTNAVSISTGRAAVAGSGEVLTTTGSSMETAPGVQDAIYAISTVTNASLSFQDIIERK